MNARVRQTKIDLITGVSNPIINWFKDIWNSLSCVKINVYNKKGGEYIYYFKNNKGHIKAIFYYDSNDRTFFYDQMCYGMILKTQYDLLDNEVPKITKLLVNDALCMHKVKPCSYQLLACHKIRNSLFAHLKENGQ